jgi:hypothetical protein
MKVPSSGTDDIRWKSPLGGELSLSHPPHLGGEALSRKVNVLTIETDNHTGLTFMYHPSGTAGPM